MVFVWIRMSLLINWTNPCNQIVEQTMLLIMNWSQRWFLQINNSIGFEWTYHAHNSYLIIDGCTFVCYAQRSFIVEMLLLIINRPNDGMMVFGWQCTIFVYIPVKILSTLKERARQYNVQLNSFTSIKSSISSIENISNSNLLLSMLCQYIFSFLLLSEKRHFSISFSIVCCFYFYFKLQSSNISSKTQYKAIIMLWLGISISIPIAYASIRKMKMPELLFASNRLKTMS